MTKYFEYKKCGCKFPLDDNGNIIFDPDIIKINLECSLTWDLISSGNTKGCFQLESRLGRSMAKKLKPESIEQLAALISIMRPGCLEAVRDGKTVSSHFIDKKNGLESVDYFHPSLEPILSNTFGEMVYQEQAMQIAKDLAGFDLQEADMLRKAIGKKKADEMSKLKNKFIKGCKKLGIISSEQADQIFSWIEKSQRYSFNKSHAVSYAMNAYLSAYSKAHFTRTFFASYLKFAKDKIDAQQEIKELIQNASQMNIHVSTPDIRKLNRYFVLKNKIIYFGLTDIKGVGQSVFNKLKTLIDEKSIQEIGWVDLLFSVLLNINSKAVKGLISSGAMDHYGFTRNKMLFEYTIASDLTKKEAEICRKYITDRASLKQVLINLLQDKITSRRKNIVENHLKSIEKPPFDLQDSIEWISDQEYELLGYSMSCSKIDMYDISHTNCTCGEFLRSTQQEVVIAGEIESINVVKTKSGKNKGSDMAFVSLSDNSGVIDSVIIFPEAYRSYQNILFDNNIVIVKGTRSKEKDSLIADKFFIPQA
jgi:DNA polymerase-3 subunit alpha